MRPLEIVLVVLTVTGALHVLVTPLRRRTVAVAVAIALVAVGPMHAVVEGARWQLAPVYVVDVALVATGLTAVFRHRVDPGRLGVVSAVAGLVVTGLGALSAWALPVVALPTPPGPAPVGTVVWGLTDPARSEIYTAQPDDSRRLAAQAWYPIEAAAAGDPAPFVADAHSFGRRVAPWIGLPAFALDHLDLIDTNATTDAPVAADRGPLPVVVYLHGWGGFRSIQADLMESLASRGYVAVALDHTYAAVAARFPDGTVVPIEPSALPADAPEAEYDAAARALEEVFAGDVQSLVTALGDGLPTPELTDHLELGEIVLIGHSTGGGAAVLACRALAERCAGVIGLDPWVEPLPDDVVGGGLDAPLLSLSSGEWIAHDNAPVLERLHATSGTPGTRRRIEGTMHRDFTLLPLLSPLASTLGLSGDTPGERTHQIVDAHVTAFLAAHLPPAGATGGELALPGQFPEVDVAAPDAAAPVSGAAAAPAPGAAAAAAVPGSGCARRSCRNG